MQKYNGIAVDFGACGFLAPYFTRELSAPQCNDENSDNIEKEEAPIWCGIKVQCDIQAPLDVEFESLCKTQQLPVCTLYCPAIIGTGMIGLPRKIAININRGTYLQIKDNDARISVVHSVDIAKAVKMCAGTDGTFSISDGTNPTIADLADALAWRIDGKRLWTIPARWAKLWYTHQLFEDLTTNHLGSDDFQIAFPEFKPEIVTEYLRTHVYNEESL